MFQSIAILNVSASNATQLITGITNPDVLIAINGNETFQNGGLVERSYKSGNTFRVRWLQNGIYGNSISMGYGSSEILLDIPFPLEPFDLEVIPGRYQFTYSIELSIRVFNPVFNSLAEKLGIPLDLLTRIPQQTLQILFGIDLEMSTDIRAIKQSAAQLLAATQAAQQTADNAVLAASTADSKAVTAQSMADTNALEIQSAMNAIVDNAANSVQKAGPFIIGADRFALNSFSGIYECYINHGLNDEVPDVEVLDSQREKQLIQSSGVDADSIKLELTADDIANNAWPLYVIVIGKPGSTLPPIGFGVAFTRLGSFNHYYRLVGENLEYSVDGVTADTNMTTFNVTSAYILTGNGRVYVRFNDGNYVYFDGTNPALPTVETTQVTYESTVGFPDRVAL